jgi:hypothetical protein
MYLKIKIEFFLSMYQTSLLRQTFWKCCENKYILIQIMIIWLKEEWLISLETFKYGTNKTNEYSLNDDYLISFLFRLLRYHVIKPVFI